MKNTTNKRIAIVSDEQMRTELIEWSYFNREVLREQNIIANQATADLLKGTLDVPVTALPAAMDGHRELTQMIETKAIDIMIYFGNPTRTPSSPGGISDLLLLAFDHNIITACNVTTAELIIRTLPKG